MTGHEGWDDYADYYDWENAQTVGRRDIAFWERMARPVKGSVLELGCGTGRVAIPVGQRKGPYSAIHFTTVLKKRVLPSLTALRPITARSESLRWQIA